MNTMVQLISKARATAETATPEHPTPEKVQELQALLLGALEDLELYVFWYEEILETLGHRADQVADLYDALFDFDHGIQGGPDDERCQAGDVDRLRKAIVAILSGSGRLSDESKKKLEAKSEALGPRKFGQASGLEKALESGKEQSVG